MKKILLCLFLLTSLNFYSQVANEVHCAGDTTFNLTYHNSLLIGNLNPAETTVSYHLTQDDATNGANPISNPTNFISSIGSQTIYARIDNLGTITTNYFSLIVNPTLAAIASIKQIDCISKGTITVTASGGKPPYLYSINNGVYSSSNIFPNLVAGTYSIVLRDASGCVTNVAAIIDPSSVIPLNISTTTLNISCNGNKDGSIIINAIGGVAPFSYSMDNGVAITSNLATNSIANLTPGAYNITVKDGNNCTSTTTTMILEPSPLLISSIVTKNIDCVSNATVALTATGGTAPYTYSKDGLQFVQSNILSYLAAGVYSIYVKDANGCIVQNSIVISPLVPLSAVSTVTPIHCNGDNSGTITITATGGSGQYTYSINGGPTQSSNIFHNLYSGDYAIKVTSNNCLVSNVITITQPATPLTVNYATSNATKSGLNDGSITINATGGQGLIKYSISPSLNIFTTNNKFSNLAPSTYQVIVQDENGCYITNSFTIYTPEPLIMTAVTKPIDCVNNATITLAATGGTTPYTYSKDGITFVQSNVFDNLVAGTYTTYVKDANGYKSDYSTTINPLPPLSISTTVSNVSCNGNNDGSIIVNATGGMGNYLFSLSNGITIVGPQNNVFYNLAPGTYTITVTDSSNCLFSSINVTILEPAPLSTSILIENQTITVHSIGGSGTYLYLLDSIFQASNVFTNLVPGLHYIMTQDPNGCEIISSIFTINPPAPLVNGNNIINQNFTLGQTLADLLVPGENIKWYSTPNASTVKTSKKAAETPLPLSTVLVDNTTYYASQTINGIESTERLAVTVKLGALGTNYLVIKDFTFYPNPVKNVLSISNTSIIDEVILISIKGETLLTQKTNSLRSDIDLSNFSKGVYFLKVKSAGAEKPVKVIKE
jgi:guanyl-specific ribonuclease Sa